MCVWVNCLWLIRCRRLLLYFSLRRKKKANLSNKLGMKDIAFKEYMITENLDICYWYKCEVNCAWGNITYRTKGYCATIQIVSYNIRIFFQFFLFISYLFLISFFFLLLLSLVVTVLLLLLQWMLTFYSLLL